MTSKGGFGDEDLRLPIESRGRLTNFEDPRLQSDDEEDAEDVEADQDNGARGDDESGP